MWALAWLALLIVGHTASASYLETQPFPGAQIVSSTSDTDAREIKPVEVALSPVEKVGREVRIEYALELNAMRTQHTYSLPKGSSVDEAIDYYARALQGTRLFRCAGRDCGRSNVWANDFLGQAILYGPNVHQRYLAVQKDAELITVYVAQRGNRRVYVHTQVLRSSALPEALGGQSVSNRLLKLGLSQLGGVTPDATGSLSDFAQQRLLDIGAELGAITSAKIYVVCHVNDGQSGELLLKSAQRCAEQASERIRRGYETNRGLAPTPQQTNRARTASVEFIPFAAGPLLPRNDAPGNRIELVVPERLWRDDP